MTTTDTDDTPAGANCWYTGVGSRDTPVPILALMFLLGRVLTDYGWRLRSGGARGADSAFYEGARMSEVFHENLPAIYLPFNGMFNGAQRVWEDPSAGIIDASKFECWQAAEEIAYRTRGSWAKGKGELTQAGKALHTRNVFQVLGETLDAPSRFLICWALPRSNGAVAGGTNTAVKLATAYGVKVINLYHPEEYNRMLDFLDRHQVEHPFAKRAA